MKKVRLLTALVFVAVSVLGVFPTGAFGYTGYTTPCYGCHSANGITMATSLESNTTTSATFGFTIAPAAPWAVFDGSTKVASGSGASGSIVVPVGKTYDVQAADAGAVGSKVSVTATEPVAPPVDDTTAPVTTSDRKASYTGDATINLTATDNEGGAGIAYVYYKVDFNGQRMTTGATAAVTVAAPSSGTATHTLRFWAQDKSGNVEAVNQTTFTVSAPGVVTPPVGTMPEEIEGANRYLTAIESSKAGFDAATTVVISRGDMFADALSGSALAGAVDGPILLTAPTTLSPGVLAEIKRLGATSAYVLGSESAVSVSIENALKSELGASNVTRLAGGNRYATGAVVADKVIDLLGASYSGKAFLATGVNFPDALASSPVAFAKGMPVLLASPTGSYTLPAEVTDVVVLGSTSVVPASVEAALGTKFDRRLAGGDRYATAVAIAGYGIEQGLTWDGMGIASGANFPDALAAGPALGSLNTVMLLTPSTSLAKATATALETNRASIGSWRCFGGISAVSVAVRYQIMGILGSK